MADLKKLADDATARAVMAAGKQAAQKALDDILPPDEDRLEGSDAGKTKPKSARRWWVIVGVVAAILVVIGVIGLVMTYWQWFLLAGIVGLAAVYGYYRVRGRRAASKKVAKTRVAAAEGAAPSKRAEAPVSKAPVTKAREDEPDAARAALRERQADEERLRELEAERDARAERELDDELAAMKARVEKERRG